LFTTTQSCDRIMLAVLNKTNMRWNPPLPDNQIYTNLLTLPRGGVSPSLKRRTATVATRTSNHRKS
jgi:hypothetical protein